MRLFTIAPEHDFLDVLADALLQGFPLEADEERPALSRWTILVPTRRAARSLQHVLAAKMPERAMLLPRITPFGDVDEDDLFAGLPETDVPDAISQAGQLNLLLSLVRQWAISNPQESLAVDLAHAPEQQFQMALSLQQLVNQIETEEADFAKLAATHVHDLAFHRSAVISLFDLLDKSYQERLQQEQRLGPSARRNRLIRMQAQKLKLQGARGPIIAAGSTGSNPATRRLLQVIATLPMGAVVFPGLDPQLADVTEKPDHPQAAMQYTLQDWNTPLGHVKHLGPLPKSRSHLAWHALRPDVTVESQHPRFGAHHGLSLVQARDQMEEALVIALRLRQHMVEGEGPAALITPDRDLAARVQAALARWHMRADDSAGEALSDRGLGSLLLLLLEVRLSGFEAQPLLALLHHTDCTLGMEPAKARHNAALLEMACVRGLPFGVSLNDMPHLAQAARKDAAENRHAPVVLKRVTAEQWDSLTSTILRLQNVLAADGTSASLVDHLDWMITTLEGVSPNPREEDSRRQAVADLLEGLKVDAHLAPSMRFADAAQLVSHHLRRTTLRTPLRSDNRIFILGLLEARLVPLNLAILGGLNEGTWPAVPETGPWLNRRMRKDVGLQIPERDIGLTAHDFVQGLCRPQVVVTWSERLGGKPALPSRLILRLRSTLEAQGTQADAQLDQTLVQLARQLERPDNFTPMRRPHARPPVAARPTRFSVTEIEKLLRDSYYIHAKRILGLEPLKDANTEPDHALRGSLIHAALARWAHDPFTEDHNNNLAHLLKRGREVFQPYMHLPEVKRFWWVRFERMASALAKIELTLRLDVKGIKTEVSGRHAFHIDGVEHMLTARADRIDILDDGSLRLIDYKSGSAPTVKQVNSGFAPQLPLEAIIGEKGSFQGLAPSPSREAFYVEVSGRARDPASLEQRYEGKIDFTTLPHVQFEKLLGLLRRYLSGTTAYLPRHNLPKEEDNSDYDHLSRRREWELGGGGA